MSSATDQRAPRQGRRSLRKALVERVPSPPTLVVLFILFMTVPLVFYVGPLRLSVYRALLLFAFVPILMLYASGRAGGARSIDFLLMFSTFWAVIALFVAHPASDVVEPAGVYVIETMGAFLLARVLVRDRHSFLVIARLQFLLVCVLLPLAIVESVTGFKLGLKIFSVIGPTLNPSYPDPRFGLQRAQTFFEHPSAYGTFIASGAGMAVVALGVGTSFFKRMLRYGAVFAGTFFSLSAGGLAPLVVQTFLIAWHWTTRAIPRRWTLLAVLVILAYIVVDLLSNRSPFHVFATYMTFSAHSAYSRIIIFDWGMRNVGMNPFFGVGLGDWVRPVWKSASMDNFWLVIAVRYGLPACLAFMAAVAILIRKVSLMEFADKRVDPLRAGYLISLGGLIVAGSTLHYWNATYVWFMFLLGAGVWFLDQEPDPETGKGRGRRNRSGRGARDRASAGARRAARRDGRHRGEGQRQAKPM